MKLIEFSVRNFRSITKTQKIPIESLTVLIGKNNEGKSNILRALEIFMDTIDSESSGKYSRDFSLETRRALARRFIARRTFREGYDWENDFPIELQEKSTSASSFTGCFLLNEDDKKAFNDFIPLQENKLSIIVRKYGKTKKNKSSLLSLLVNSKKIKVEDNNSREIVNRIMDKISFKYIPVIRTEEETYDVIESMLSTELAGLKNNRKYKNATSEITELRKNVLNKLEKKIKEPLSEFLPNIVGVEIRMEDNQPIRYGDDFDIIIDDGTPTRIELKGEGIKSLVSLGALNNLSIQGAATMVAIEEPESHLHSDAIHQIAKTIKSLTDNSQVLIATHSPLLVDRNNIKSNIIVDNGLAKPAKDLAEIRELLGIKNSDNLYHAENTLIVEGEYDALYLMELLPALSKKLSKAIKENSLVIKRLDGASKLKQTLRVMGHSLPDYHVWLDHDQEGCNAFLKAEGERLVSTANVTFAISEGMKESEFEDLFDFKLYNDIIKDQYGVDLDTQLFRSNRLKWSDRVKKAFRDKGKYFTKKAESNVKSIILECIESNPTNAIVPEKSEPIDSLIESLEKLIKN